MAKKTAKKKSDGVKATKAKGRQDAPNQKVMKGHASGKVPALEKAGVEYVEALRGVERAKEKLQDCDHKMTELLKKKRRKNYTVAGKCFKRVPGAETLSVTNAS